MCVHERQRQRHIIFQKFEFFFLFAPIFKGVFEVVSDVEAWDHLKLTFFLFSFLHLLLLLSSGWLASYVGQSEVPASIATVIFLSSKMATHERLRFNDAVILSCHCVVPFFSKKNIHKPETI